MNDETLYFMQKALEEAKIAALHDDVPIGAVIVKNHKIIARAHNQRELNHDTTAHAEIRAIQLAGEYLQAWILNDCQLYVTLEPCIMCFGAIIQARIPEIYFGAYDPKTGACGSHPDLANLKNTSVNHHSSFIGGIMEEECSFLLKEFFKQRRIEKKNQNLLGSIYDKTITG